MNQLSLPSIFNDLSDAFFLLDAEGCFLYANARAKELFGFGADRSLSAMPFHERFASRFGFLRDDTLQTALTRRLPLTLEAQNQSDERWYELRFYPSETGMAALCHDVTHRKQTEVRDQFLTELSERIHTLSDAQEMLTATVQAVGAFLNVTRCYFSEIDLENDHMVVHEGYHPGVPSLAGHYTLSHFLLPEIIKRREAGKTDVVNDTRTHPHTIKAYKRHYHPHGVAAYIGVPLRRQGKWVAAFVAESSTPRPWRADEASLMEVVAQRAWLAIENARLHQQTLEITGRSLEDSGASRYLPRYCARRARLLRYEPALPAPEQCAG